MERIVTMSSVKEVVDDQTAYYLDCHLRGVLSKCEFESRKLALVTIEKIIALKSEELPTKEIA